MSDTASVAWKPMSRGQMAERAARDIPEGWCVNLGIGMPTMIADYIPLEREVIVHSENGILGMVPAVVGEEDPNLIDAGKAPVGLVPGGSYISHADSFAIIRGGHLDVSVMGALQVSAGGDLANWWSGQAVPGVGGAMDLAVGAREVFVMMRHLSQGQSKLVAECTLPLTARGVVTRIYTEYGIFEPTGSGMVVLGLTEGTDVRELQTCTAVELTLSDQLRALPRLAPSSAGIGT